VAKKTALPPKELPLGLAIDPGNAKSGWVYFALNLENETGLDVESFGIDSNEELRSKIRQGVFDIPKTRLLIETPKPRGMPTAGEEMETLIMIGRFVQEWSRCGGRWSFVFRQDTKLHLTGSVRAKDGNVNQAIRDRFGGDQRPIRCEGCKGKGWRGPGRPVCDVCKGAKFSREPGPIFGITSHAFAALAIAIWWVDTGLVQQHIINPGGRDPRAKKKIATPGVRKVAKKTSKTVGH
jgi:hypothetical protein